MVRRSATGSPAGSHDLLPYTVLSHTADTGIEATAGTFPELLCDLATGMFHLMGDPEPCTPDRVIEFDVESTPVEELVVDALSDLLYHSEVEDLFLCRFDVQATGPNRIHITTGGIANESVELTGPPIKAVTYHEITVQEISGSWFARVYFDV